MTSRTQRRSKAANLFKAGQSRQPYGVRKDIVKGMKSSSASEKSECSKCSSLLDLKEVFQSLVHSGGNLRRRKAINPKPASASYRDLTKQNDFLLKAVFDAKGNYLYHRDCIRSAFGISNQRLSRLRKVVQAESSGPTEYIVKQDIFKRNRMSDVVLPRDCDQITKHWLDEQPDDIPIECKNRPGHHGNAKKQSNHAKSDDILEQFLVFVDNNSTSNGRKEGSYDKMYYFDRKFTQIRTPDKKDPQFEYKNNCMNSIVP